MLDFLGIGAQKAGTTWLYNSLQMHEKIQFPAGKEIHFWDQKNQKGIDWYASIFGQSDDALKGEITPAYSILPVSIIEEVYNLSPRLKIIYTIRNPMERAWSSAKMALTRAEMMLEEASDQWFIDHFKSQGSLMRGNYEQCIVNWRNVYPEEQILIQRFEMIKNDPERFLNNCFQHLGVREIAFSEHAISQIRQPIFSGVQADIRVSLLPHLRGIYARQIESLGRYLRVDFSDWLG